MRHYLTNMENRLKPLVAEAIQLCGRNDIHIDDDPMPYNGDAFLTHYARSRHLLIGEMFSLYMTGDIVNASDFWATYRKLKESERWRVFLLLSED